MKILHRHNNGEGRGHLVLMIVSLFAVALVGIDSLFGGPIRNVVRSGASIAWSSAGSASVALEESGLFVSHRTLAEENLALRMKIASLEAQREKNALLSEENTSLRMLTNTALSERATVSAPILSQTDASVYGTFLLGAGSAQGLIRGAQVRVHDNILLGLVSDVSESTALVRSLLAPGALVEGHIGSSTILQVSGRGGGNGIAHVPRDVSVNVGDPVYYSDLQSIIGIVGAIESTPENAEKTIYLRVPINTLGIRFVTILPPL